MTPKLESEGVVVRSADEALVGPVSLALDPGACVTVMGETGAGKSLLARAIIGLLPRGLACEGRIRIDGRRVDEMTVAERAALWGRSLALLPQEPWRALDPIMRAGRQVEETHRHVGGLSGPDARAATDADLAELDVRMAGPRLPGALSGGMAQRVAFAAAKAGGAPLVIADEPTKGLDADRAETVTDLLKRVPDAGGALLTVTHDLRLARRLGGAVLILKDGAVVETGCAEKVLTNPSSDYARALLAAEPSAWTLHVAEEGEETVLSAQGLVVGRGGCALVRDFDLELRRAERVAIAGPSGSGKTSLLDTFAGVLVPLAGRVVRSPGLPSTAIQKLYQDPPAAFPDRVPLLASMRDVCRRHEVPWERVQRLLVTLGIAPGLLERRPSGVSGGELQRIALARVLMIRPAVLLADEPTSRLDPITQAAVIRLIAEVAAEQGMTVVLVTHDRALAEAWTPRIVTIPVLSDGQARH